MAIIQIDEPRVRPQTPPTGFALFALGFRPFYLLGALFAALSLPLWIVMYVGAIDLAPVLPGMLWHGHEMVFGFAVAIIAGFLLTAGQVWSGLPMPKGWPLAALVALWLAGRLVMFSGMPVLAAVVDLAFLPTLAIVIGRVLYRARNRRNYFAPLLLLALAVANALAHAGAHAWLDVGPLTGLHLAVALITVLETVIAGRIVPSFTANALKTEPWRNVWVDRVAIVLTGLALVAWAFNLPVAVSGALALPAAAVQLARIWGWRPLPTLGTPLLWILHLAHGWIVVALLILALAGVGLADPASVPHILSVGAMGGLIVGMITRTALGHTGRTLKAGLNETVCYWLISIALILRVAPWFGLPASLFIPFLHSSATVWTICFLLYLWRYVPILVSPRVDGRPG